MYTEGQAENLQGSWQPEIAQGERKGQGAKKKCLVWRQQWLTAEVENGGEGEELV